MQESDDNNDEDDEQSYAYESTNEQVSDDNDDEASGPPLVLKWQGNALLPAIDHIYTIMCMCLPARVLALYACASACVYMVISNN